VTLEEELRIGNHQAKDPASSSWRMLMLAFGILLASSMPQAAVAGVVLNEPILGGSLLVASDGAVTAEFLGSDAGYFNTLYLDLGEIGPDELDVWVFDKSSRFTSLDKRKVALPGEFAAGSELVFRLDVRKQEHGSLLHSYYTGDKSRNPDGLAHAEAITAFDELTKQFITTVGFEDLFGGGDNDFNDFSFQLTNVVDPPGVPEPPILLLLSAGLGGIVYLRNRRFKKA
jgi:hypothetical protein